MGADSAGQQDLLEALQRLRNERRVLKYKLTKTQAKFEKRSRELRALEAEIASLTHRVYESGVHMLGTAWLSDHDPQTAGPATHAPADPNDSG